ncbi:MAG TPA: Gfo/Idh/MocA family oxidoreductase [Micromonosporaceae bacterium]|nr:Gfo/Idh/MocA family oxidoreductase [Micromonosporaceae bacterium]
MPETPRRRRYAIVGTGSRAEMFAQAIAVEHADVAELVALADPNPVRLRAHRERLTGLGAPAPATYPASEFTAMLDREQVDVVVVTTVDRFHDEYIVAAVEAGRDVITEKPMTTDAAKCRRILEATARTGRRVTVTFNYRYNPLHEAVRQVLASGEIGEVGSVHFEWLLDVRHGADYFRRWHRDKANSGGLMVHKASHHFDLVNWWLGSDPVEVYAAGRLFFYGDEAGRRHGFARSYDRAHGAPEAADDPFALRLADNPHLAALYLDAEAADGYHRDQNVFAPGVTIEDDMAVLVRYASGASMSYHLTAYSPWEGYRIAFNGSLGRLELDVVENDHVRRPAPAAAGGAGSSAALHGVQAAAEAGSATLRVRPFWTPAREVPVTGHSREGHGGADTRMLADLLRPDPPADPLGRSATERDGATALLVGLAANRSFETGLPVRTAALLGGPDIEELTP